MRKFVIEILLFFFLPLSLIAVVAEYSIRKIPNDYEYKSSWLTNNSNEIDVLYLGPSTIFYDIDPKMSKWKGFNASHVSQSLKYDNFIFNKYIDQMKSLKYVVLGIDYWSPSGSMENGTEWWRIKYYTIYYDSPYHQGKNKYKYEIYFHNTETFSTAFQGLKRQIGIGDVTHKTVDDLGFGLSYSSKDKTEDWDNGIPEGERHNKLIDETSRNLQIISDNYDYVKDICEKSKERGIKVILLGSPHYKSYNNTIERRFIDERNRFCENISSTFDNVKFLNLSESDIFYEDDYYDAMHLNEIGAKKFTDIVDKYIDELTIKDF